LERAILASHRAILAPRDIFPPHERDAGFSPAQVNFFTLVAMEVRSELARLGLRSLDELVGRADLLRPKQSVAISKTAGLDLSFITRYAGPVRRSSERINQPVCPVSLSFRACVGGGCVCKRGGRGGGEGRKLEEEPRTKQFQTKGGFIFPSFCCGYVILPPTQCASVFLFFLLIYYLVPLC
jgi:hypothetical protein